jgi:oxygen-independent coproporphyrinogen III oxidase
MYGLYLHIPFCRKKCKYCDFVSVPYEKELADSYTGALINEMKRYEGISLATVYMGGGTPTVLSTENLSDIFNNIYGTFDCNLSEITVEANPESLNEEKLLALRSLGINRLSVGVQSMCVKELESLGRVHSPKDFWNSLDTARGLGFENINIDLIYGLPNQALVDWQNNLKSALCSRCEHISIYPLTVEPDTEFHRMGMTTDENSQAEMYDWSLDFLENAGYEHYEISNWALPGLRSSHNMIYWQNSEYIGIGAAAASYLNGKRWKNICNISAYVQKIGARENPVDEIETIDSDKKLSEEIILKLRCMPGMCITREITQKYGHTIEQLVNKELLEICGKNIRLTRRGLLLANIVMKEFV